ncbi:hypothetical protein [Neptuniibacter sp. QD57_21]|uniref:hypothetical protein n=1 Tax=Neptuniibacter sp. QD57_21 TaxID=3398213 RepID=UPI0039F51B6B
MKIEDLSPESLVNRAKDRGKEAAPSLRSCVEIYYIVRYFVSLYEANNLELPVQIWNEYRNALDHFMRHTTESPDFDFTDGDAKTSTHLNKMEGHLQRAALDIMKIVCHVTLDKASLCKADFTTEALRLADQGNFNKEYCKLETDAKVLFTAAKVFDDDLDKRETKLGIEKNATPDKLDGLDRYIKAAIAAHTLDSYLETHLEHLHSLDSSLHTHKEVGKVLSTKTAIIIGFAIGAVFWLIPSPLTSTSKDDQTPIHIQAPITGQEENHAIKKHLKNTTAAPKAETTPNTENSAHVDTTPHTPSSSTAAPSISSRSTKPN